MLRTLFVQFSLLMTEGSPVDLSKQVDDAVVTLTDGQMEIKDMIDANRKANFDVYQTGKPFEETAAGKIALYGLAGYTGVLIGVALMCLWLRRDWNRVLDQLDNVSRDVRSLTRQYTINNTVMMTSTMDAPPSYDVAMETVMEEPMITPVLDTSDLSVNVSVTSA